MDLPTLTIERTVQISATIAAVGAVYDSLEFFSEKREVLERFFDWRLIKSRYYLLIGRPVLTLLFDIFFSGRQFVALPGRSCPSCRRLSAHGGSQPYFWSFLVRLRPLC